MNHSLCIVCVCVCVSFLLDSLLLVWLLADLEKRRMNKNGKDIKES